MFFLLKTKCRIQMWQQQLSYRIWYPSGTFLRIRKYQFLYHRHPAGVLPEFSSNGWTSRKIVRGFWSGRPASVFSCVSSSNPLINKRINNNEKFKRTSFKVILAPSSKTEISPRFWHSENAFLFYQHSHFRILFRWQIDAKIVSTKIIFKYSNNLHYR